MISQFKSKASAVFKSITCDNRSEFSEMHTFENTTEVHFAHPFSFFERGTNERLNALLRQFIPKGKSMNLIGSEDILHFGDLINGLPRKIFGYNPPEDLFEKEMDEIYSTI